MAFELVGRLQLVRGAVSGVTMALALAGCVAPKTAGPAVSLEAVGAEALAQQRFVLNQRRAEQKRVLGIHHRLSAANLEFCNTKSAAIGVTFETAASYPKEFAAVARAAGIGDQPVIAAVLEASPAEAAGLKVGDELQTVNGTAVKPNAAGYRAVRKAISSAEGPVTLGVKRGAETLSIPVTPEQICGYPIAVPGDQELNAYADGDSIVIPRGMVRFAASDTELALVIGHEMAHNAMGHIDAKMRNQMAGAIGGAILDGLLLAATGVQTDAFTRAGAQAGANAYSKGFESEADYVGLYFMARAGYDISDVESFWRRMAAENPQGITFGSTHPTSAERFVALAAARDEIRAKQLTGEPLRPRLKSDAAVAPTDPAKPGTSGTGTPAMPGATPAPAPPVQPQAPDGAPAPATTPVSIAPK